MYEKTNAQTQSQVASGSSYFHGASEYLKRIDFNERLVEGISDSELKKILYDCLEAYIKGKIDQYTVLGVGDKLYDEAIVGQGDKVLLTITCRFDDLVAEVYRDNYQLTSADKLDKIIRDAFEMLKNRVD